MNQSQPERVERGIEEIVQTFQHEYGQYTSLGALSIASDWLRNTLHQELQKTRTAERERVVGILQNMKGVYSARDVIEKATEAIRGNERKV